MLTAKLYVPPAISDATDTAPVDELIEILLISTPEPMGLTMYV